METALWAKLERNPAGQIISWHSLVDHSADVAAVLCGLLAQPTISVRLSLLGGVAGLCPITIARLGALAFLHDIGKANRGFRARFNSKALPVGHIDTLAWLFGPEEAAAPLRDKLIAVLGLERLESWFVDGKWDLFEAVFAHHGRPWNHGAPNASSYWRAGLDGDPIADLASMRAALDDWFPLAFQPGPVLPVNPAFHHAFAGLLMLADWLGSDKEFFPYGCGGPTDRMSFAQHAAAEALKAVGLAVEDQRTASVEAASDFSRLFGVALPRPLQSAAIGPDARLLILEAETGSGKTEAALWRFANLFARGEVDGIYFALPTRVAASQMFGRVRRFRNGIFGPHGPAVLRAVPGQIGIDDAEGHPLPNFDFEWSDDPDDGLRRARWAGEHPKRFLAAQLAVGTIDQVLLGALAVKHAHLRGAALLRHLLVVDEVHASDTYMEGLLVAMLRAHLAAGGHALLLSATLGGAARARLLGTAWPALGYAEHVDYPALSWAEAGTERRLGVPRRSDTNKRVRVVAVPLLDDPAGVARDAFDAARRGARVLVIRNTVGGAVAVQRALEALAGPDHPMLFRANDIVTLHHGRFALGDRRVLDAAVEMVLGGERAPGGLVVIGTQTLEQSLDIDADLLLTDLCPVDVLLQRVGRLHRHARVRVPEFEVPQCRILVPVNRDLLPFARRGRHGLGAYVYDDLRIIEATWRLVELHGEWRIPAMNRMLVERATHPEVLQTLWDELALRDPAWTKHIETVTGEDRQHSRQAALSVFNRNAPFGDFRVSDERLATRLGGADLQLAFDPAPAGPFGVPVVSMRLPCHMRGEASPPDGPVTALPDRDGFTFVLGQTSFRYTRLGLERG